MKKYLSQFYKQFLELQTRERLLAIAALMGVIYFLFDVALLRPQHTQAKALRDTIAQQELERTGFNQALQSLAVHKRADPLAKERADRDELRKTIADGQAVLGRATSDVKMGEVIRALVAETPGLTLVSLKTIPVQMFFDGAKAPTAAAIEGRPAVVLPTLYRHGVEVVVQGKYLALIPYLQALERNPNNIFWGDVKLDVATYPEAILRLTVFTLSARPELPLG